MEYQDFHDIVFNLFCEGHQLCSIKKKKYRNQNYRYYFIPQESRTISPDTENTESSITQCDSTIGLHECARRAFRIPGWNLFGHFDKNPEGLHYRWNRTSPGRATYLIATIESNSSHLTYRRPPLWIAAHLAATPFLFPRFFFFLFIFIYFKPSVTASP